MSTTPIVEPERTAVLKAFEVENSRPLPQDWSPVAKLVGIGLLIAAFYSGRIAGLLQLPKVPVMGALGVAALIAFVFGMMNFAESEARRRAEAAIEKLAHDFSSMNNEETISAAVSLIVNAFFSGGPYTRATVDLQQVRGRLGASLAYVEAVEEILATEKKAYRVVTSDSAKVTARKEH